MLPGGLVGLKPDLQRQGWRVNPSPLFGYVVAFILGTIIGSFVNVCVHRLPRRLSVIFPGSHCPACQQAISPWGNIPLLSYVALQGYCAACQSRISWRYPLLELACGLLYVFLYDQWSVSATSVIMAGFITALLVVSYIDMAYTFVPDAITLPGIVVGLGVSALVTPVGLGNALLGVALGGGIALFSALLGLMLFDSQGMGLGDVKLLAMIGAFLGWQAVIITIVLASISGACVGLVLILIKRKGRRESIPFGPFLALGAFLAAVWGESLIAWYLPAAL
jgi:leader peptidase (prepilin peptidase) / N-methyltransferase